MYVIRIIVNGEYHDGEDAEIRCETFEEACIFIKKFTHSNYPVEVIYDCQ